MNAKLKWQVLCLPLSWSGLWDLCESEAEFGDPFYGSVWLMCRVLSL